MLESLLVGWNAFHWVEYLLVCDSTCIRVKVRLLNTGSLFKECNGFGIGWVWQELRSLVGILGRDIASDGAGFCKGTALAPSREGNEKEVMD